MFDVNENGGYAQEGRELSFPKIAYLFSVQLSVILGLFYFRVSKQA